MDEPDIMVAATKDMIPHHVINSSTSAPTTTPDPMDEKEDSDVPEIGKVTETQAAGNGNRNLAENGCGTFAENGSRDLAGDMNGHVADGGDGDAAENGAEDVAGEVDAESSSSGEDSEEVEDTEPDDDSAFENDENPSSQVQYTEEAMQGFLDEFLQSEEEAAEAQENLEDESLEHIRKAVFEELSETHSGDKLDAAVTDEMTTYMEEWEEKLADLEDRISLLQEKLDDCGVNLPDLYKWLEKQVPERCTTEAWRKRTHWAGLLPTPEAFEVVKKAEKELTDQRPVRRHHGRLQDEGASGFLAKKIKATSEVDLETPSEDVWSIVDSLDKEEENPRPGYLMGTEKWANVYLVSTPEQAAQMGLSLPGADIVEEIGDMDSDKSRLFKEALANEREQSLTGQQRISLKKVCEEDDVKRSLRLQKRALPPRSRKPRTTYIRKKPDLLKNISGPEVTSSGTARGAQDLSLVVNLTLEVEGSPPMNEILPKFEKETDLMEQVVDACMVVAVEAGPVDKTRHVDLEISCDGTDKLQRESSEPWIIDSMGVVFLDGTSISGGMAHNPNLEHRPASDLQMKQLKHRLTPTEIEAGSHDAKKSKTMVVIDSEGEHEELVEDLREERWLRDEVGRKRTRGDGGKSLKDSAEFVVVGSRKDSSQLVQLEKLKSSPQDDDDKSEEELLRPSKRRRASSNKFYQDTEPREFPCTACGMLLKNREVLRHPLLDVGICRKCKNFLFSGPFHKDEDGSEDECRWCGQGGDVLCCESCDKVFCSSCIERNLGKEALDLINNSADWQCFLCDSEPLYLLQQKYKAVKEAMKAQLLQDNEEEIVTEKDIGNYRKRKGRRNIRRVLDDRELDEKTKSILSLEKERQERLESWRAKARASGTGTPVKSTRHNRHHLVDEDVLDMDDDDIAKEGFIINKARQEDEEPVRISPHISGFLRSHQLAGLRFMWENCIESASKVKLGAKGLGCILAHSMGLGKTLQVIAFIHTLLKRVDLGLRTVLIVVPVNVLHNWRSEFNKWSPDKEKPIHVYMLEDVARDNLKRAKLLSRWQKYGGVMLIGYTAFRNLSLGKSVKEKSVREELCASLQHPGPDILVCDEAHMIKNGKADITQALKQVRTHRRIALTGSPLQNNLMEYYCMVDFVREGFLGPAPSFKRRFQNPIENGQRADSTTKDVKLMKHRAHILHKQLKGFVQRKNMSVLKEELPSKCVYVISVRLSPLQRALYLRFLQVYGFLNNGSMEKIRGGSFLFEAHHTLAKIWNHPDLLLLAQEEKDLRKEDNVENFIVDIDDEVPDVVNVTAGTPNGGVILLNDTDIDVEEAIKEAASAEDKNKASNGARSLNLTNGVSEDVDRAGWWRDMMEGQQREIVELSGKMVILLKILSLSSAKGDKALVFSQSLHTLDLIEKFLGKTPCLHGFRGTWRKNRDWYSFKRVTNRLYHSLSIDEIKETMPGLDGQTSAKARQDLVESFNNPENTSVQCVLISTRAGSLGINLPAANRVIIFDGSWNPTHDLQALFRAWRFGQKKPVYAYRLLASGTMEEKIYNRQVAKEALAARVLDEHQVGRFFVEDDLDFLFVLDKDDDGFQFEETVGNEPWKMESPPSQDPNAPSTSITIVPSEEGNLVQTAGKLKRMAFSIPDDAPPRDDIMGKLLLEYRPKWVVRYHEHEPLLEDLEDEKLSKEEQALAWESFQHEGAERIQTPYSTAPAIPGEFPTHPQVNYSFATHTVASPYFIPHQSPPVAYYPLASQSAPSQGISGSCTTENHVRQLKAEGIRAGSSTSCGLCKEVIAWETIKRS